MISKSLATKFYWVVSVCEALLLTQKTEGISMPNDLDTIAQLEKKIHQLPQQLLVEVEDYVDFLLQKYQKTPLPPFSEIERKEELKKFFAQFKADVTDYCFNREEANER